MKTLILIRHAKSSWEQDLKDHQRSLKKRGYKDADLVSKALFVKQFTTDLIISSDAVRTRETAEVFIKNLNISEDMLIFNHDLYDFSGNNLVKVIKSCDNVIDNLMIFGHNNALTAFVNTFGDRYINNVPTCGVTVIEFDITQWSKLIPGKTRFTLFPRDLKS